MNCKGCGREIKGECKCPAGNCKHCCIDDHYKEAEK